MALNTYTDGVQAATKLTNDVVVQNVTVNAATTNVDQSVDGVIELFNIPQGALVHTVSIYVATVEDSAATLTIGDGADADGFLAGIDATAAGLTTSNKPINTAVYAAAGGKIYTAADTIDLVTTADLDTLVAHCQVTYTIMEALD
jgi:hypothetical protein